MILDSDIELETVNDILKDQMNSPYTQYYAGVRADTTTEPRVFKTVLSESHFLLNNISNIQFFLNDTHSL